MRRFAALLLGALVGNPGRDDGWILYRQARMDTTTYQSLPGRFAGLGYERMMFRRVPQFPDQIGKPGFIKSLQRSPALKGKWVRSAVANGWLRSLHPLSALGFGRAGTQIGLRRARGVIQIFLQFVSNVKLHS